MRSERSRAEVKFVFLFSILLLLTGCQRPSPAQLTLTLNPNGTTPLAAEATLNCDQSVILKRVLIEGGLSSDLPENKSAKVHRFPVLGFYPGETHHVTIEYQLPSGDLQQSQSIIVETPPLPKDFPMIESVSNNEQVQEGGFILVSLAPINAGHPLQQSGLAILTDTQGRVIWYWTTEDYLACITPRDNGHLLIQTFRGLRHQEVDWLGRVHRTWQANGLRKVEKDHIEVAVDTFHHEVQEAKDGSFWTLSTALTSTNLVDDLIVRYGPGGKVLDSTSLVTLYDKDRVIHQVLPNIWELFYSKGVVDWGHSNSLVVDEEARTALVSLAYQDAVIKVDLEQKSILWTLGRPKSWKNPWKKSLLKAKGKVVWPFKQHSANPTKSGHILLFDNGEKQSRAVEFRVDESKRTVEQVWEYRGERPFFSPILGDARELPKTGNIQLTDGFRLGGLNHYWGRVVEVSHQTPSETLLELKFTRSQGAGCAIYRSLRIPRLYQTQP